MACGTGSLRSRQLRLGSWTLLVPEFFRETRFTHFTKVKSDYTLVKCSSLLEQGEEYKEGTNTYSRACARDNGPVGNKKLRAKAHAVKRRLARLHWDNCKVRFDEAAVFSFAAAALTAGFLEADIIAAYDRALHRNHARATDCRAIWDTGSTVSDARQLLAKTSRRFEPGQVDPEIASKMRQSLLSASASDRPKEADRTSTMERPNKSLSDAMIADQATPATLTSALTVAVFRASLEPFSLSANRRWRIPRSPGPNLQARAADLIRSTRISNLSAPFPS